MVDKKIQWTVRDVRSSWQCLDEIDSDLHNISAYISTGPFMYSLASVYPKFIPVRCQDVGIELKPRSFGGEFYSGFFLLWSDERSEVGHLFVESCGRSRVGWGSRVDCWATRRPGDLTTSISIPPSASSTDLTPDVMTTKQQSSIRQWKCRMRRTDDSFRFLN